MEKILIIGGVAAGATAAAKARRISATAQITMLEAGADISFANCGLPYYIGGDIESRAKLILQSPESFKEQYEVDVHTHTMVTAIDRNAHIVTAEDTRTGKKKTFEYTKLILAQGGKPIKPEIAGAEQDNVFSLWTLQDMDKIDNFIKTKKPRTAVVAGGGFIGLEMVEALVKRGMHVSVVEMMPHVMSLMEPETAGFIEREMLSYGVEIFTNTGVNTISQNKVRLNNGKILDADMIILSIGVRPTLQLAKETGLVLGESGGLLVNDHMQTSDPDIYAGGDMIEVEHRVNGKKVRIPLAGPANRQGRIAAENALGGTHRYKGALGTSVVRVFEAVAGITGYSLKQALAAGYNADAVVVHKEHHTSYYPGAENVTVMLVYDKNTGIILGGQTAGYKGADKRLDVIATAVASKLTVADLADIDFAYSPPIGTANDALNMAAYTAENKMSGFSHSVTSTELDAYVAGKKVEYIDVRDVFAFEKSHIKGAKNIPLELFNESISTIAKDKMVVIYDENGKKGHQALRTLVGAGFTQITNISGGHISLQRHALAVGFKNLGIEILPIEKKEIGKEKKEETTETIENKTESQNGPIIVDVRSRGEFRMGAVPGAINIPLEELDGRYTELGERADRDITLYCASGARSAYALDFLEEIGYQNVKNGGSLSAMMAKVRSQQQNSNQQQNSTSQPQAQTQQEGRLVVDVRTRGEFQGGAYPNAINIPMDELPRHLSKLGNPNREIIVYCASGARSSYAQRYLMQNGFSNVKNGGGIMQMMRAK